MKTALLALIRAYRYLLSPWIGNDCRFWPTCSEYAQDAIEQYGALRGGWMMLTRLARCHPYSAGGIDPVPQSFSWRCWRCSHQAGSAFSISDSSTSHASSFDRN
ncbi:MAG: membrane protein insertion efficiency factor YidD [Burkholderiaceae bacterium]|nr:membrane protein insertion efficiency factor YidD [Burkholderiaceae bacterium]